MSTKSSSQTLIWITSFTVVSSKNQEASRIENCSLRGRKFRLSFRMAYLQYVMSTRCVTLDEVLHNKNLLLNNIHSDK
jgi:hypothetical protein